MDKIDEIVMNNYEKSDTQESPEKEQEISNPIKQKSRSEIIPNVVDSPGKKHSLSSNNSRKKNNSTPHLNWQQELNNLKQNEYFKNLSKDLEDKTLSSNI